MRDIEKKVSDKLDKAEKAEGAYILHAVESESRNCF